MNIYSSVVRYPLDNGPVTCAMDLLVVALEIIDYLPLPGDVGAHLDNAVNLLRKASGEGLMTAVDLTG